MDSARFEIDPETGIAFGDFQSSVRPGDLLTALAAAVRLRGARSGLRALADLRSTTVYWQDGEELDFRRSLYAHFPARITGRCALLAPKHLWAPDGSMPLPVTAIHGGAEMLLENLYLRVDARLFRDFGQAMRWLLQSDEARHSTDDKTQRVDSVPVDATLGMRGACRLTAAAPACC